MRIENAFLIHGANGTPDENWMPWIRANLERNGITVYAPQFSHEQRQTLKTWLGEFEEYKESLNSNSIIIGHSVGCAFVLRLLERINVRVKAVFLVAPFTRPLNIPKFDELNKTFLEKEFDWERITRNCEEFFVYGSDNDPYVKMSQESFVAEKTGGIFKMIPHAGHINEAAGYKEFRELYEDIKILY
ncbi:MAG: serine hydrolase family protein [Candidatus Micrarchaeota archaeon]|nr:serine hydrolase family protein [Candidatus Micrarchaeota archaeon]